MDPIWQWFLGIGTALGGVVAGIGGAYWKLRDRGLETRKKERQLDREDQRDRDLVSDGRIKRLEDEIASNARRILHLEQELDASRARELKYIEQITSLKGENTLLSFQIKQLQSLTAGAAVTVSATITADMTGTIVDADDGIRDVLGWRSNELRGTDVDIIIPRDLRNKHHAGFERVRTSGLVRPMNMAIQSYAKHRNGDRIPVIVSLTGWEDDKGTKFVTAQIIHRKIFTAVEPGTGELPKLPVEALSPPPPVVLLKPPEPSSGEFKRPPVPPPPG